MADYPKPTGTSGTLIIRDNGSTVQFIVKNTQAATHVQNASWSGRVNFVAVGGTYSMNGVGEVVVGSWTVGADQTVEFNIAYTGTQGLGGPTYHSASIKRATVPPAPTRPVFNPIGHNTATVKFSSTGNGGSPTTGWELRYGTSPTLNNSLNKTISSTGTSLLEGLQLGTMYYAWARGRNAVGWGPWSAVGSARTLYSCHVKVNNAWEQATAYVKVDGVWLQAIPYVKINGAWVNAY